MSHKILMQAKHGSEARRSVPELAHTLVSRILISNLCGSPMASLPWFRLISKIRVTTWNFWWRNCNY